ncbi:hypothetical protein PIB30_082232 [Stylosanthes scabra]|uniref:Uncharacterized protein n=1 Tax=Stylosanthes scabra TaxID=79078 RepID=A0ABU6WVC9_9FABA|nr:hypothetical protein [Stylosanthes scabra]
MAAENNNAQRRTLGDYTIPSTTSCGSSIVRPTVEVNNFELKPSLIQLVQQSMAIAQQLTNLNKKIEKLEVASMGTQGETSSICGLCGGPHENHNFCLIREDQPLEQANYMGNQQRQPYQDPNANTYNPRWRNHPKLGWGGNQNQRGNNFQNCPPYPPFQRPPFPQPTTIPQPPQPKPHQANSFEAALEKLTLTMAGFVQTTNNFIEEARANFRNHESSIRDLETQMGQIAKQLSTPLPKAFLSDRK